MLGATVNPLLATGLFKHVECLTTPIVDGRGALSNKKKL
jgi:hypothetical protein